MRSRPVDPTQPDGPAFWELILDEWVKVAGILAGAGALPLLLRLVLSAAGPFWVLPLAAGGLMICAGLFLAWRQARQERLADTFPSPFRYLEEGQGVVPPWELSAQMRFSTTGPFYKHYKQPEVNLLLEYIRLAQVFDQPLAALSMGWLLDVVSQSPWEFSWPALEPSVAAAVASKLSLKEWLESAGQNPQTSQFAKLRDYLWVINGRLDDPLQRAADFVSWMAAGLYDLGYPPNRRAEVENFIQYLRGLPEPLHPSELPKQLAGLENAPGAKNETDGPAAETDPQVAATLLVSAPLVLIALGLFLLLPGLVTLIALAGGLAYPERIAWFFSAPAVLVWAAAEGTGVFFDWKARQWASVAKGLLQAAGAALILVYLAIFYSQPLHPAASQPARVTLVWMDWLLAAGGGLAVISALLASVLAVVQSRAASRKTISPPASPAEGPVTAD